MAGKNIRGITVEIGGDTTKLGKALETVNGKSRELQNELKRVEKLLKYDPSNVTLLQQKQELLNTSIANTRDKLDKLKEAQESVQRQFDNNEITAEQYRDFQREIAATEQQLERLTEAQREFGSVTAQQLAVAGQKVQEVGTKVSGAGKAMLPVTAAVGAVGTAAVTTAATFEESMSQVAATMGMTAEEINAGSEDYKRLEEAAREMGASTKYSASEAAEALNYLALAGYDVDKSINTLPQVLNLAAAGGIELAAASDMVTDAMSALGSTAGTTESFVDKMAKTSQKSNTSVAQLGEGILTVGGTAKVLAGETTELNTCLGILADNGVKGAEGGTALRNIILSLSAPTDKAAAAMEDLGLNVFDADGNMRPLNETFKDLDAILATMNQGEQTQVLSTIFNKVDLKSVNALLANSGTRFNELSGYIANADGAASDMAATMQNNLKGQLTTLNSAISEAGISIGQALLPIIKSLVEGIQGLTDRFNGLSPTVQTTIIVIAGIMAALGPLLIVIGNIITAIGKIMTLAPQITTAITAVKTAFAALGGVLAANPIGAVVTALAALAAGLVYAYQHSVTFRNIVDQAFTTVKDVAGKVVDALVKFFTQIIPNALQSARDAFTQKWNEIINYFQTAVPNLVQKIEKGLKKLPEKIGYIFGYALGKIIKFGQDALDWVKTEIPKFVNNIISFIKTLPSKIATWLTNAWNGIKTWGKNIASSAKQAGQNFINNAINMIKTLPGKIATWLTNAANKVVEWKTKLVAKAKDAIASFGNAFINGARELPAKVQSIGRNIVDGVWQGIKNARDTLVSNVKSFFNGIVQGAKDALGIHSPSKVFEKEIGEQTVNGLIKGINNKKENAKKSAEELSKVYVDSAKSKLKNLEEANKITLAQEITFWQQVASNCKKGTSGYKEAVQEARKAKQELTSEISSIDKQYAADVKTVKEQLKADIQEVTDAYDQAIANRQKSITSSLGLFEEFSGKDATGKGTLTENLRSQVDALEEWDSTLDSLSKRKGMTSELMNELQNMSVENLYTLKELNTMSDAELAEYISLYNQKQAVALERAETENKALKKQSEKEIKALVKSANKQLTALEKQYKKDLKALGVTTSDSSKDIGKNIVKGLKKGIESQNASFQKFLTKFFKSIVSNAANALEIHSPSRLMERIIGAQIPAGIAVGIEKNAEEAKTALNNLVGNLTDQEIAMRNTNLPVSEQIAAAFGNNVSRFGLDNTNILTALNQIAEMLKNMRVYLDSGELVGGMISEIDEQLNIRSMETNKGWY